LSNFFVKFRDRFSECYVLNVIRIDKLTDVQSDCKITSQEQTLLKLIHVVLSIVDTINSLPSSAGIVTSEDTRMWVISYMTI